MSKNNFVGVWKLVASEFERADGVKTYPYGEGTIGMLIYDEHGYMSVHIMRPDRPIFASGDIRNGTQGEIKTAFNGYLAYFGRFDFNENEGTVTHHIQGSHFPNWVGQDQKRSFEFSDNRLIIKTQPIPAAGTVVTGILIWEREVQ
jgi:hypothetical protein